MQTRAPIRRCFPPIQAGFLALAACLCNTPGAAEAGPLDVPFDQHNAEVEFVSRFAGVLRPEGAFDQFSGVLRFDAAAPLKSTVSVRLKSDRIHVGMPGAADRLRSPDYFDAAHYPEIVFRSTDLWIGPDGGLEMAGMLTMRGVTRRQTLEVSLLPGTQPSAEPSGFVAEGIIHRRDFGMVADPFLVGNEIDLRIQVSFARLRVQ